MSKRKPKKRIATLDLETDPFLYGRKPEPFILGFWDGEDYSEFIGDDCIPQFLAWLSEQPTDYAIYAHNGGKFDYHFFIPHFDPHIMLINGRISKATIGKHEFLDSYLILPLPLKAYQKDEFDYTLLEKENRYRSENLKKIRLYLRHDCEYLYEWVNKFTARFGRKLTLASAAFAQLKKTGYEIPRGNQRFDEVFRRYYFGGRVQVFEPGSHYGDFEYYDINSAYPRAMLEKHPWGTQYYQVGCLPSKPPYFARILAVSMGALPQRAPDGSLTFPADPEPREFFATGWEIQAGLETGTLEIKRVINCYKSSLNRAFTEYVEKYYAEKLDGKQSGDKDMETFAKLMLNSAYGKFGMDPSKFTENYISRTGELPPHPETESEPVTDEEIEETLEIWQAIQRGHDYTIWERDAPGDSYYNVATAASITGYVRAFLWRSICAAEKPIYCDTDSIMCERFKGKISDKIGDWKLEARLSEIHAAGKKLYAAKLADSDEWKTASKGARLTPQEIKRVCSGDVVTWEKDAPSYSLRYGARFTRRNIKLVTPDDIDIGDLQS